MAIVKAMGTRNRDAIDLQCRTSCVRDGHSPCAARRTRHLIGEANVGAAQTYCRRWVRIADWAAHVGLDLGLSEGAVVDAHLVDHPLEELAEETVPADLQRVGRGRQRPG